MIEDLKVFFLIKEDLRRINGEKTSFQDYEEEIEENKEFNFNNLKFFSFIILLSFIIIFFIAFRNREIEERELNKRIGKKF
jgi:hypothetical protein